MGERSRRTEHIQSAVDTVQVLAIAFRRRRMLQLETIDDDRDPLAATALRERLRDIPRWCGTGDTMTTWLHIP